MAKSKSPKVAERRITRISKIDALMAEIATLSDFERDELMGRIDEAYPMFSPSPVPDSHIEILKERLAEAVANPGEGKPWREVLEDLRRKK